MSRDYFVYSVRLIERDLYILWFTDDVDGVLVSEDGRIVNFLSVGNAIAFATKRGLHISIGISCTLDLTWISDWSGEFVDCIKIVEAWNLFADVAASLSSGISFAAGGDHPRLT